MVRRVRFSQGTSIVALAVFAALQAGVAGCAREARRPPATSQTETTGAIERGPRPQSPVTPMTDEPVSMTSASGDSLFRLAAARCERAFNCGNVGRSTEYSSRDECLTEALERVRHTYRAAQCPGGIDRDKLDTCVATVRTTRCDADVGEPDYLTPCSSDVLCQP